MKYYIFRLSIFILSMWILNSLTFHWSLKKLLLFYIFAIFINLPLVYEETKQEVKNLLKEKVIRK